MVAGKTGMAVAPQHFVVLSGQNFGQESKKIRKWSTIYNQKPGFAL